MNPSKLTEPRPPLGIVKEKPPREGGLIVAILNTHFGEHKLRTTASRTFNKMSLAKIIGCDGPWGSGQPIFKRLNILPVIKKTSSSWLQRIGGHPGFVACT